MVKNILRLKACTENQCRSFLRLKAGIVNRAVGPNDYKPLLTAFSQLAFDSSKID